jgi:hypothetical protein
MKSSLLLISAFLCLIQCTSKTPNTTTEGAQETSGQPDLPDNVCFAYAQNDDIIGLTLTMNGNKVNGKLAYAVAEKDRNSGTIDGSWKGDTLIGEYSFHSEGRLSTREIVFLRKGDTLVEGYGEVEQVNTKTSFKSRKNLQFLENFPLKRVPCRKDELINN